VYYTNQLVLNARGHSQYRLSKCLDRYNVCVSVERQRLQGAVSTKAYEHVGRNTIFNICIILYRYKIYLVILQISMKRWTLVYLTHAYAHTIPIWHVSNIIYIVSKVYERANRFLIASFGFGVVIAVAMYDIQLLLLNTITALRDKFYRKCL